MKEIVIMSIDDDWVVKRVDVTGKSDRQVNKIEDGININLDLENYYTLIVVDGEEIG